jgi:hypothetical protein
MYRNSRQLVLVCLSDHAQIHIYSHVNGYGQIFHVSDLSFMFVYAVPTM